MKTDLISREALKTALNTELKDHLLYLPIAFKDLIDNAPTVELTETEIQEVLNKRCMTAVANEFLIALHMRRIQATNNAELFKQTFGIYATEVWAMSESKFLEWLNEEVTE
jgi:hypothetical protein